MQAESLLIEIQDNGNPTTEYIETELKKLGINPIRWAIVGICNKMYTISVTNLKE